MGVAVVSKAEGSSAFALGKSARAAGCKIQAHKRGGNAWRGSVFVRGIRAHACFR